MEALNCIRVICCCISYNVTTTWIYIYTYNIIFVICLHVDKELSILETLLNHFVDLVQQRNLLLQRIKKSRDGPHLKIEAAFQKYVWMSKHLIIRLHIPVNYSIGYGTFSVCMYLSLFCI